TEDGLRVFHVTGVQTCALPICRPSAGLRALAPPDDLADRPRSRRAGPEGAGPRAVEDGARQAGREDAAERPDVLGPAGPGLGERSEVRRAGNTRLLKLPHDSRR